ncbi:T3SS effector HopA1 family protein [Cellulophaga sp. BC115SP]|uniref:T3SS effector HopA1 family protein n=1 Tax=Cellulophaga sp. BC115SP TaxID=2683263 RepID=UPI001412C91D|nr:T3SS effector HopA1 family protein [Cellulophaga sp. BC115SP]NBB29226.1 hypothetical protein [Cellulophaga sp. BC115SP]
MMNLRTEIKFLLDGISYDNNIAEWKNVHANKSSVTLENLLYHNYHRCINLNSDLLKDQVIESFQITDQVNNISKFWFVVKELDSEIIVEKESHIISVPKGEYTSGGKIDANIKNNQFIFINTQKKITSSENNSNSKYWVHIFGDKSAFLHGKNIVRVYFNLKAIKGGVIEFSKFIADYLDEKGIPYSCKYLNNLKDYKITDSAVLYVSQNNFNLLNVFLREISMKFGITKNNLLRRQIPLFTQKLFNGIGFAEEPIVDFDNQKDKETSFGMDRCTKISEIIEGNDLKKYFLEGNQNTELALDSIIDYIQKNNIISIDAPYRNPSTGFRYSFPKKIDTRFRKTQIPFWGNSERSIFLDIAKKYANDLCSKAVWLSSNECTWITYHPADLKTSEMSTPKPYHRLAEQEELDAVKLFLSKYSLYVEDSVFYQKVWTSIPSGNGIVNSDIDVKEKAKSKIRFIFKHLIQEQSPKKELNDLKLDSDIIEFLIQRILSDNQTQPSDVRLMVDVIGGSFKNFSKVTEKDATLLGYILHKYYEKEGLPIRNLHGTYDFCAGLDGSAGIGLFFLLLYNPRIFSEVPFDNNPKFK